MYYYVHDGINASTSQRIPLNKPLIPSSLFHDPNYHNQLSARQCFCFSTLFWFHSSANYWCLLASGTLFQLNTNHINNNDGFFCSLFSFNNVKFCFATSVSIWFSVPWFVIGWLQLPFDSAQFTSRVWLWLERQLQPDHHMMALLDLKLHGMFPADNAVFFIYWGWQLQKKKHFMVKRHRNRCSEVNKTMLRPTSWHTVMSRFDSCCSKKKKLDRGRDWEAQTANLA